MFDRCAFGQCLLRRHLHAVHARHDRAAVTCNARYEWLFEWYDTVKAKEERKETQVATLMNRATSKQATLKDHLGVMRVVTLRILSPVTHSAESSGDELKAHCKRLQELVEEARAAQTDDAVVDAIWSEEYRKALLQKQDLLAESAARLRDRTQGQHNLAGRRARARRQRETFEERVRLLDGEQPTDEQREMLRVYLRAFYTKFEQFDPAALEAEVSIVMTTWDVERANAELTRLHRRMTNTRDTTYRGMVRSIIFYPQCTANHS